MRPGQPAALQAVSHTLPKVTDSLAVSMKHQRHNPAGFLQLLVLNVLLLQERF